MALASPPPALAEELVEEILLRFPPHEPSRLVHAALVCKRWCRLISARCFRRTYRELHRKPPMLGFVCSRLGVGAGGLEAKIFDAAQLVPTAPVRWPLPGLPRRCRAPDARHGRVLLRFPADPHMAGVNGLAVWDPVTNEKKELPSFTPGAWWYGGLNWNAGVLCAAGTTCDHLDCHRGSFIVVFMASGYQKTHVFTYSSDADTWSETISTQCPYGCVDPRKPSVLVANALYFQFLYTVLKYDLQLQQMSSITLPSCLKASFMLITTEGGGLGLATIHKSKLSMWSRNDEVDAGWTQSRVVELDTLIPANAICPRVVGFAGSIGVMFVAAGDAVFTIDLRTYKVKKVFKGTIRVCSVVPFMSFYTPALKAAYTDDEAAFT